MTVKIIRALNRGLNVLRIIQESKAASLHDLHLTTRLPKATLLRILKTLIGRDFVWQRIADGAYVPSYTFSKRARVFDEETHLAEVAAPILADLCKRVRWPSILLCPRLDHMVVVETNLPMSDFDYIMSPNPLGTFNVNMLRSASGRCYLAFCSPKDEQLFLDVYGKVPVPVMRWRATLPSSTRRSPMYARAGMALAIQILVGTMTFPGAR